MAHGANECGRRRDECSDAETLDADALRDFLKQRLASFKVPREILVLREEEFAVTGSGKIKFKMLRDVAAKRLADR
jgi:fatty-acyl-CoA synthase